MKEKLIELIGEVPLQVVKHGPIIPINQRYTRNFIEQIVDKLIANGVTIREKKRCKCCGDGRSFFGQTIMLANDGYAYKIHYCPNCGADMRGEVHD